MQLRRAARAMMRRRGRGRAATAVLSGAAAVALVLALAGAPAGAVAAPAGVASVSVAISEYVFTPQSANIDRGGTVVWKNTGQETHTVTGEVGLSDSGPIKPGDTYTQSFANDGTYFYFCAIHLQMRGAVVVGSGKPNFGRGGQSYPLPGVVAPPAPLIGAGFAYPPGYGFPGYGYSFGTGSMPGGYSGPGYLPGGGLIAGYGSGYGYGGGYGGGSGYGAPYGSSGGYGYPYICPYPYAYGYAYGSVLPYYGYAGYYGLSAGVGNLVR